LDAFDLYLRALAKLASYSPKGIDEAIELLDRAIGLSPGYAQALAYAALCRALRPVQGHSSNEGRDFLEATELTRRALDCDPTDPIALSLAGVLAALLRRDYQRGCDLVDRSLAINPNHAFTWGIRGWINAWAGESETAIVEFRKSLRLNPLDPNGGGNAAQGMANALCWAGRTEEALPWARRAAQERPGWSVTLRLLIGVLWLAGRHAEAKEAASDYVQKFPSSSLRHAREVSPLRGTPGQERFFEALEQAGLPE
jgi:tetratricopeptide (TPR) repeat protein